MKHLSLKSLVVVMLVCTPLFASNAFAQVTYDSVVNKAINNNNTQSRRTTTNPPASDEYFGNVNALPLSPEIMSTFNPGNSTGVSANNPDAAWEAVKKSQPHGFKRNMTDLDDYTITDEDILAATEDGVINVNKIPDSNSGNRNARSLGELCCPDGTSYVFGICTRVNIDRTSSTPQYSEYSPGYRQPGAVCQGYNPIPGARILN